MKKIFIAAIALFSYTAQAQKNVLLEQSFWKSTPDVTAVKAEIAKGNNPAQLNGASFDPVVMAINSGAPNETIKFLLEQPGNDVNKLTHDSRSYFHWAASKGNTEIMEFLVSKGIKTGTIDSHGATPLNFAAGGGQSNTKVYDICIAQGADLKQDLNDAGANALLLAIANDKNFALTDYFISKGLSLKSTDKNGNNAFSYAARSGKIDLLKALLEKGVPATDQAFLMAAQGGRGSANTIELYQYLESIKLNPKVVGKQGETALHAVVRRPKQNEIVQYFLSKGLDAHKADEEGNTAFMLAAATNPDIEVLNLLTPSLKDINQVNAKGVSALAMAVRTNSPEVVAYLINKGASVTTTDKAGDNLAAYLVQSYSKQRAGDFDAKLKILQEKGLKMTQPQKNGNTLYHLTIAKNDLDLVKLLEPLKIDINAKNSEGMTALHKAAMISKDDAILKYLVSMGAKKDIQTSFQETAFDLAGENESLSKNNVQVNFLK